MRSAIAAQSILPPRTCGRDGTSERDTAGGGGSACCLLCLPCCAAVRDNWQCGVRTGFRGSAYRALPVVMAPTCGVPQIKSDPGDLYFHPFNTRAKSFPTCYVPHSRTHPLRGGGKGMHSGDGRLSRDPPQEVGTHQSGRQQDIERTRLAERCLV